MIWSVVQLLARQWKAKCHWVIRSLWHHQNVSKFPKHHKMPNWLILWKEMRGIGLHWIWTMSGCPMKVSWKQMSKFWTKIRHNSHKKTLVTEPKQAGFGDWIKPGAGLSHRVRPSSRASQWHSGRSCRLKSRGNRYKNFNIKICCFSGQKAWEKEPELNQDSQSIFQLMVLSSTKRLLPTQLYKIFLFLLFFPPLET